MNIFHFDPDYEENEAKYDAIRKEILGSSQDEDESGTFTNIRNDVF